MEPLSSDDVRSSFVNCSKGEAKRMPMPRTEPRWDDLDFLGWRDVGAPDTAYLVVPGSDGPVGLVLRRSRATGAAGRKNMCEFCRTTHSATDMALMVAPRPGASGRNGNTVGTYLCADLACSLYARGLKRPQRAQPEETLDVEAKVARLQANVATFVRRVTTER
ncbi:MAG: FBP domain-containing protein [Nocardioides sp.]|uniref:FBP domain-containing protein n=1 Tax=Nocardioides sp. TaxID=35761 RepID=UPI003F082C2B